MDKVHLNTRLSRSFTYREAIKSSTATRLGIDNDVANIDTHNNMRLVAHKILQPARDNYNVSIVPSSWYRCLKLNRALKSKDSSDHIRGCAVDFEVPGIPNIELAQWLWDTMPIFDQIILEYYNEDDPEAGWVHASIQGGGNKQEVITYWGGGNYTTGLPDD